MDTIFEALVITALTVLYALAWHNQPARYSLSPKRPNGTRQTS
jgi:hypothetical protein